MVKCSKCGKVTFNKKIAVCPNCGTPLEGHVNLGCTIDAGVEDMRNNKFTQATGKWRTYVRSYGPSSDAEYEKILQSTKDCIVSHLSDSKYYSRGGISELASDLPDREFMVDLLDELAAYLPHVATKRQLSRLVSEYVFIVFDAYFLYPDLSDMVALMRKAHDVLLEFQKALPTMAGESKNVDVEIGFFVDYTTFIADKMNTRVKLEGRERMARIVQYWDSQKSLAYAEMAINAAQQYSRAVTAQRPSDKKIDSAKAEIDRFLDYYFLKPFGETPTKKKRR